MASLPDIQLAGIDFKCNLCCKQLYSKQVLQRHMRRRHTNGKDFKCHLCSKEFHCKEYLRQHMEVHTESREFKCHLCSKEFSRKKYLKQHMILHTELKEFKCHLCSKEFNCKAYLKKHMASHAQVKEFKCHLCRKEFKIKVYLTQHLRVHRRVSELKCNLCSKEYYHKRSLMEHLKRHGIVKDKNGEELICENFPMVNCAEIKEETDTIAGESSLETDPLSLGDEKFSLVKEEISSCGESEVTPDSLDDGKFEDLMKKNENGDGELYCRFDYEAPEAHDVIKEEECFHCEDS